MSLRYSPRERESKVRLPHGDPVAGELILAIHGDDLEPSAVSSAATRTRLFLKFCPVESSRRSIVGGS
jgi:hypothetical protein